MVEQMLNRRALNILRNIKIHTGLSEREAIRAAIESGEIRLSIYRHCGQKTAADIAAWAGATIPPDSKRKKRSTIEVLSDMMRKAVLAKAKTCQHALVAYRGEADGNAVYAVFPDGRFKGYEYAEGEGWDEMGLSELAYLLEHGKDEPDIEEWG